MCFPESSFVFDGSPGTDPHLQWVPAVLVGMERGHSCPPDPPGGLAFAAQRPSVSPRVPVPCPGCSWARF